MVVSGKLPTYRRGSFLEIRFFSRPYSVLNVRISMEKVNGNISIFLFF